MQNITCVYFSPTHGTKKAMLAVAEGIAGQSGANIVEQDITLPAAREQEREFGEGDIVLVGGPVYAGRLPQCMLPALDRLKGMGAKAVAVVSYGNREYDDALLELADILQRQGFEVVAGCAFVAEHSYTGKVAPGRPDEDDLATAREYGRRIATKLGQAGGEETAKPQIKGNRPYLPYKDEMMLAPDTTEACTDCMLCAEQCPVAAISFDNPRDVDAAACIHCHACVKFCPEQAKTFGDKTRPIIDMLEKNFMQPKSPELIL